MVTSSARLVCRAMQQNRVAVSRVGSSTSFQALVAHFRLSPDSRCLAVSQQMTFRAMCGRLHAPQPRSGVQLIEQRLGLFQIKRVEAFGEPAIDRSEKIAGFLPLALIAQ